MNYRVTSLKDKKTDKVFERFILQSIKELTPADVTALRAGVNNLSKIAREHGHLTLRQFLERIFNHWNSTVTPGDRPSIGNRSSADVSIVCGTLKADSYTQNEHKQAAKEGKNPSEMGFKERAPFRKQGAIVRLKVRPERNGTQHNFVDAKHQFVRNDEVLLNGGQSYGDYLRAALNNYDANDVIACATQNAEYATWQARVRLHEWYQIQAAVPFNKAVTYHLLPDEDVFVPMTPMRTCLQMYGHSLDVDQRNASALAIQVATIAENGVDKDGSHHFIGGRLAYARAQEREAQGQENAGRVEQGADVEGV